MFKSGKRISNIYFVDRHRSVYDGMLSRFRNTLKYSLKNFSSIDGLVNELTENASMLLRIQVAVLVVDNREVKEIVEKEILQFVTSVKKIDPNISLIVVAGKKTTEIEHKLNLPASYSLVQNNDNAILKITNLIMGMISRESLEQKYISARRSVILFVVFIIVSSLFGIYSLFFM
ncbi:MAG: hypothetical protein QNK30_09550 [Bacteroidales bacterium]|nr:hypothetical protein [Bacteroidales bacterium]